MEALADFGLGRLSEADSVEIEVHLADCEECRKKLEEIPDDALVCLLHVSTSDTQSGRSGGTEPVFPTPANGSIAFTVPRELEEHSRYLVLAPLGAGGMGTVYKARHRLMDRVVALKIIHPQLIKRPGAKERFTREVKIAAQLVHPNIVTAYDAEQIGDTHLLVMEYVEGRTLAQILAEQGELPIATACDYLHQAALGLQHAFERGMIHRDVKPQNLMLVASADGLATTGPETKGQIKILDFGLARFVMEQALEGGDTEVGLLMGSPDYIAPEQAHDAHSADTRADIYGLGCTLYHLLAGHVPFPQTSLLAKLEAHRDRQPIPLDRARSEVPAELARIVAKMMAKDPAQRFQTPGEVALALRPFTIGEKGPVAPPHSALVSTPYLLLIVVAGLLIAGIGSWAAQFVFRVETPQGTLIVKSEGKDPPKFEEKAKVAEQPTGTEPGKRVDLNNDFAWPAAELSQGRIAAPNLSQAKVLYRDDFANLDTTWPIAKTALHEYGRDHGTYFISASPGLVRSARPGDTTYTNVACQVVGRITKATSTQWYLNYMGTNQVSVRFHLNGGGELELVIINDGPPRRVQLITHSAFKSGEEFNKLLVVAEGNRFEIFANDVAICNPIVLDVVKQPGRFALGAVANDNPVRAEFNSFTIWSADGLPTPEERLDALPESARP